MLLQALPRQLSELHAPAICFSGRSSLPFARPQMLLHALPRQVSELHAPAICFSGRSSLPFARPQMLPRPCQGNSPSYRPQPSVFKGVQACHLPALKCSRKPCQGNSPSYRPQPSVFNGVHACCLLGLQMLPTLPQAFLRQLSQLQAPVICFSGRSSLPGQDLAQKGRFQRVPEGNFNCRPKGPQIVKICFQKAPLAFLTHFEPFRGRFQSNSHSYK